jgi:hypothetical protein
MPRPKWILVPLYEHVRESDEKGCRNRGEAHVLAIHERMHKLGQIVCAPSRSHSLVLTQVTAHLFMSHAANATLGLNLEIGALVDVLRCEVCSKLAWQLICL